VNVLPVPASAWTTSTPLPDRRGLLVGQRTIRSGERPRQAALVDDRCPLPHPADRGRDQAPLGTDQIRRRHAALSGRGHVAATGEPGRTVAHLVDAGALPRGCGELPERVALVKRVGRVGQAVGAGQAVGERLQLAGVADLGPATRDARGAGVDRGASGGEVVAVLAGSCGDLVAPGVFVVEVFALTRREREMLGPRPAHQVGQHPGSSIVAERPVLGFVVGDHELGRVKDLVAPTRELRHQLGPDVRQLRRTVGDWAPLPSQPVAHLRAQMRLIQKPGGPVA